VVIAVRSGAVTLEQACQRYELSVEEFRTGEGSRRPRFAGVSEFLSSYYDHARFPEYSSDTQCRNKEVIDTATEIANSLSRIGSPRSLLPI
jgi:hypothetical protein